MEPYSYLTQKKDHVDVVPRLGHDATYFQVCCFRVLDSGVTSNFQSTKTHRQILCAHSCKKQTPVNKFYLNMTHDESLCSCAVRRNWIDCDIHNVIDTLSDRRAVKAHCLSPFNLRLARTKGYHMDFIRGWTSEAYRDLTILSYFETKRPNFKVVSPNGENFLAYKDSILCFFCAIARVYQARKRCDEMRIPFSSKSQRFGAPPYLHTIILHSSVYYKWRDYLPICSECKEFCVLSHYMNKMFKPDFAHDLKISKICGALVRNGTLPIENSIELTNNEQKTVKYFHEKEYDMKRIKKEKTRL